MDNNKTFTYRYSAKQNIEIENIRKKYLAKEENKLDELRRLDNQVSSAGMLKSLILGIFGCLIFGVGMCFGLDVFFEADWLAILLCGIGTAIMISAYPIYKHIATKTKEELGPRILRLSDEIMKS